MSKLQPYGRGRASCKRDIQRVLDTQGRNYADVASLAGVTIQTVSATMNGYCHSPKVLEALRSIGIPERFLFDPRVSQKA